MGCLPTRSKILSGGEFYPEGCTVDGKALYTPDVKTRTFEGPHYVIPEDTLNALIEL